MVNGKDNTPDSLGLYDARHEKDACGVAFICSIKGEKSNRIVRDGLSILCNLEHRGATGSDPKTGDGAGLLIQVPHDFLAKKFNKLPATGEYAVGNVFFPKDEKQLKDFKGIMEKSIIECGLQVLGWRRLEVDNSSLGNGSLKTEPITEQIIVGRGKHPKEHFELILYRARKRAENAVEQTSHPNKDEFYVCSLSSKVLVYKGMFLSYQLPVYFKDFKDDSLKSAIALVHQRFSTNTFPNWKLAHPFRYVAHNGEFNTIEGNINMMSAREYLMKNEVLGLGVKDLLPIITPGLSDTGSFDCGLELMLHTGRSLPHVLAMMIPEAWGTRKHMNIDRKSFYQYHANLMEPWDGPATIVACNGDQICAILDRNGLRPARFCVTKDDHVIFASEAGTLKIPEKDIVYKSRLWPGKMVMVDLVKGTFQEDDEIKAGFINKKPYKEWLERNMIQLEDLPDPIRPPKPVYKDLKKYQRAFGYTEEDLREHIAPMAMQGQEPVGSMGNDAPFAVLSKLSKPFYNYFRQRFAQVTNPAIDSIREELVMGVNNYFGAPWNVFEEDERFCRQVFVSEPILTDYELEKLAQIDTPTVRGTTLPMLFEAEGGVKAMKKALDNLFKSAAKKIDQGYNAIILSDRGINQKMAAIPAVLALSGLNHYLIRNHKRGKVGLIVETGEACLVHHMAVLISYGAVAINPYLAFESIRHLRDKGVLTSRDSNVDNFEDEGYHFYKNYTKSLVKGLLKIMSKMGISTVRSYCGAQVFEIIGIKKAVVDEYFTGTISQVEGIGLEEICNDALLRHRQAFEPQPDSNRQLEWGAEHKWRPVGEHHLMNPETIALLQHATRSGKYQAYKKFSSRIDDQSFFLATFRGLLKFKKTRPPVHIDEVEPVESIVKRFCSGAMSLGSISTPAHETLAIAMNKIGGKSNTGEGGEDARRFEIGEDGENRNSAIKQVASGRFGVTPHYLANAREIQIKIAQGAKPGEGGQLPGHKIDEYIAKLRHSVPGVTLISPPPHHDIYSIEDLAQLIYDLKNSNPQADINVKLVSEAGVGTVAAGVAKAHAEVVTIAGHDGGTGASPISSIKHAGTPWEFGLAETHQTLVLNGLRSRIRVQADGQMRTGRDIVIAAILGAEEYGFATVALVTMGCIMMRKCHLNTCPVGIATQDKRLLEYFKGEPQHVINYFTFVAMEVREHLAELGYRSINEIIGQVELLEINEANKQGNAKGLDLSRLLKKVELPNGSPVYCCEKQDHNLENILDRKLIEKSKAALDSAKPVKFDMEISNFNRTTGTMLSGMIAKKYGADGLPEGTIQVTFTGTAGQSFGAFLARGVSFTLYGEANDYLGKGMSGGQIVLRPAKESTLKTDANWIAGNTLLYGATGGRVFIAGRVGERFAVRNSGCVAVVEGVGDHGCEYMTGGTVVVLGHTGRNFAAGMSGGLAYVVDPDRLFSRRCNLGMVDIEQVDENDFEHLRQIIAEHLELTHSQTAKELLANWDERKLGFVKVIPREYRKVLAKLEKENLQQAGV